jgi:TRAP-type C4-dicarboxylate transport system substrate-binding protein
MFRFGIFALAALVAASTLVATSHAGEVFRATGMLPRTLIYTESFMAFIDAVNNDPSSEVSIQFVGGPEAIPAPEQAEAVRNGVVDMIYGPSTYYLGMVPEVDALLGSNLGPEDLRANGGLAILDQIHQDKLNAKLLGHPDAGHGFHIYLTEEPPISSNGMPDLTGQRIRGAQLYREFFQGLGATYVAIKVPEVYTALERGTVSGVGWPSVGLMDLSWDNFLRYRIDPAYFQTELVILVNLDRWSGLSDAARAVLTKHAIDHEIASAAAFQAREQKEDAEIRDRGVQVVTLDNNAAATYRKDAIETAWARLKGRDDTHYDALRATFYQE